MHYLDLNISETQTTRERFPQYKLFTLVVYNSTIRLRHSVTFITRNERKQQYRRPATPDFFRDNFKRDIEKIRAS